MLFAFSSHAQGNYDEVFGPDGIRPQYQNIWNIYSKLSIIFGIEKYIGTVAKVEWNFFLLQKKIKNTKYTKKVIFYPHFSFSSFFLFNVNEN